MRRLHILLIALILGLTLSASAKSVRITGGQVEIIGTNVNGIGNPYNVTWQIDIKGESFARTTFQYPDAVAPFNGIFGGGHTGYENGQRFPARILNLPFFPWEQSGTATFRSFSYSSVEMNGQETLQFRPQAEDALIVSVSSSQSVATVPFEASGTLILKCSRPGVAAGCRSPIRRVRIYGKGTVEYTFARWTPSDGQWPWLNVKSVKYRFED